MHLLCILFWLHCECQTTLNRTGSRSSWRQEQTLAGTEAGSHCGLAGPLWGEARPLLSANGISSRGANDADEDLKGVGCETLWKQSANTLHHINSEDTLCLLECYFSQFCFRHVPFLLQRRAASSTRGQKYQGFKGFTVFFGLFKLHSCPRFYHSHLFSNVSSLSLFLLYFVCFSASGPNLSPLQLILLFSSPYSFLSVASPIPLSLICILSLHQSQIIPSLRNWKIGVGESKREIILSD